MKLITALAGIALVAITTVSAEARDRWYNRKFVPWHDRNVYFLDDEFDESDVVYEDDETADPESIYLNRRQRWQDNAEDSDTWWLEDNARDKLQARAKARRIAKLKAEQQIVKKPAVKKLAAKPKAKPLAKVPKPQPPEVQTASLEPLEPIGKATPKAKIIKPALVKPVPAKPIASKTIGCTAGAAVVTGYGFGEVKPKACTGTIYAYTAARDGKVYEIKLTAASGEITDVKKLN
jgi:hypothetical protein